MNIRLALLFTRDPNFEDVVTDALKGTDAEILPTHDLDHALQIGCQRGGELDVAIIDRNDCHAITLFSAIKACCPELPVVVVLTPTESFNCTTIAYANGAAACLAKPISAADLRVVLRQLCEPKLELGVA